jgi:hypothetical protein
MNHIERQIKTRLGFLMKASLSYSIFDSRSSLIDERQQPYFKDFQDIRAINSIVLKTGPGLGANIVVFKRIFFSLRVFLLANYSRYDYTFLNNRSSRWNNSVNVFGEGGASIGYNSKRFFASLNANGDVNEMQLKGAKVRTNYGAVSLDIGYRFNSPRFLDRGWEKLTQKRNK